MLISFELSMPGNNSWNGKWSGEGRKYVRIVNVGASKKAAAKYGALVQTGYFSYDFGDGWRAGVTVTEVDAVAARKLRKQSAGFCGYEWMIESIRYNGKILSDKQRREQAQTGAQS